MNMLNYKKNNNTENTNGNILIWILWIIRKIILFITQIIIFFRWILCIRRKIIILTTQIIISFILILRIVEYF
jgi:hypothetical protein